MSGSNRPNVSESTVRRWRDELITLLAAQAPRLPDAPVPHVIPVSVAGTVSGRRRPTVTKPRPRGVPAGFVGARDHRFAHPDDDNAADKGDAIRAVSREADGTGADDTPTTRRPAGGAAGGAVEPRAGGTWDSALSVEEFAAVKGVGFEPVGQVLGTAVFTIGYTGLWGSPRWAPRCGPARASGRGRPSPRT